MNAAATALCVFAKAPEAGLVKTRLAADIGPERALQIYHRLLAHTAAVLEHWPGPVQIHLAGDAAALDPNWRRWPLFAQSGDDLGARLRHGLTAALERYGRVIAIGSDCLELTPAHLAQIADLLGRHQAAIGRCDDGGYWALGLADTEALTICCASDLPWSRADLVASTRRRCTEAGVDLAFGATLRDIDDVDDLERAEFSR